MRLLSPSTLEITHFHLFCGSGGGGIGFQRGHARVGALTATMRCIGGVDIDPAAVADFTRLVGVPATVLDLADEAQHTAIHGAPPPAKWRPAHPASIRGAAGGEHPDIVFLSPPCKGFSGLLNPRTASAPRYQALNALTLRGIRLMLAAFAADLPALVILENVPRIAQRGRALLDEIRRLLEHAGYAIAETTHDCGELGGLAQHRRRFLLVARHREKVPPFLYEPPRRRVRGVGEVLSALPLPDDPGGGPMHRSPRLQWQTWVRLALIPAGGDWRSLLKLQHHDLRIERVCAWGAGDSGVVPWSRPAGTISGQSRPRNGSYSVADPRPTSNWAGGGRYRVTQFNEATGAVIAASTTGNGANAVADPRAWALQAGDAKMNNIYRLTRWTEPSPAVTAGVGPSSGDLSVADPRPPETLGHYRAYGVTGWEAAAPTLTSQSEPGSGRFSVADPRVPRLGDHAKMRVETWGDPAHTITGSDRVGSGALSVADPRIASKQLSGPFKTAGHFGVVPWAEPSGAVTGSACQDNGAWSVADPRPLPEREERPDPVPMIIALDGTWHRPFTTLELAALQDYPVELLMDVPLTGTSEAGWREHIGNSVPIASAQAIGSTMAHTLLLAFLGERFRLESTPIWVQPLATAVSVSHAQPR